MSFFQSGFDATKVDPAGGFEPIPEGAYRVLIKEISERPTKNGKGLGLNLKYEVVEGKYARRTLFHWINLRNQNKTAEEIGQAELAALCHATGILQPRNAQQFAGKTLRVDVVVTRDDFNGGMQNKIKRIIIDRQEAQPAPPAQPEPQPAATTNDASQDDSPPWG